MADFRRLFYALALVAMLAGLTVPASAQNAPFQCIANAGVPPIVRGEGYTELVGDLTLNCQGGIPTPAGQTVPPVNFTILLNTNITSRLLAGNLWDEALLIVDEPHSAVQPTRNILNCGHAGAPDTGSSGPGVCAITSIGQPALTYDGTPNVSWNGSASATCVTATGNNTQASTGGLASNPYGCGRPNVFQGRTGTQQNPGQFNSVTWLGVPLDPPGTTTNRTIRFTNIRADAVFLGVSSTFTTNFIQAQISVNGNTSLAINNPQQIVAFVQKGLIAGVAVTNFGFLQCTSENAGPPLSTSPFGVTSGGGVFTAGTALTNQGSRLFTPSYRFQEGFASSWKPKNIAMVTNQAGNGVFQNTSSYWKYDSVNVPINYPPDQNQNVPGAIYNTESGFEYPTGVTGVGDPAAPGNPPNGIGTQTVSSTANSFSNAYNLGSGLFSSGLPNGTNISGAGIADQGTRLALQVTSIPNGAVAMVPQIVYLSAFISTGFLTGTGNPVSGVMVLTNTDANGAGAYSPPSTPSSLNYQAIPASGLVVYEVLFADPFALETATVPVVVAFPSNLAQNLPQPGITAQAAGSFAPFYSTASAHNPSSTLPIPRFIPGLVPQNFFLIGKCACNILFPYVVSVAGYDTGIAIANTSLDPGGTTLGGGSGFGATPQAGSVEFWYYGAGANGAAPPATQCTNTASPGTCPGTTTVPAGQVLTYVASTGSSQWGLDNRANGFAGYVIAQAQFQYCHAFAFIGALGAGPLTPAISEGYLGLILDNKSFNSCANTGSSGDGLGLCRTNQQAENLVH